MQPLSLKNTALDYYQLHGITDENEYPLAFPGVPHMVLQVLDR
jgi:hypothetical protein